MPFSERKRTHAIRCHSMPSKFSILNLGVAYFAQSLQRLIITFTAFSIESSEQYSNLP